MMIIKREKQVMYSAVAHHPLTYARSPFPNPDQPFQVTPPSFYTGRDVLWCGISFCQFWSQLCSLKVSLFISSVVEQETRKKDSLTWDKHNLAKTQNISVLPPLSFCTQNTAMEQLLRRN